MATSSTFILDYRSPPSGDGTIQTPDGRTILLTSDGNAMGHPDYYSEIRHFPRDHANGGEDLRLWASWLHFIFQELAVDKVYDCEFNYEGDRGHLIEPDGNITAQNWLNNLLTYA